MSKDKKIEYKAVTPSELKPGMVVRVHQKIKDQNAKGEEKERLQVFEGLILSRKHGSETGATFCVRKVTEGIGVEKTYPLYSPLIDKIELVDTKQVNRAKLYFARSYDKRLKSVKEK
ncbi:50S ribosomal protein L19 [Candidatus Falkowbacteria bacterium]|nr:50S ribosomal protein L19 [Candidatus Falkowbacteria bacterium]